jgi:type VI secretion system protein ImpM
MAGAAGAVGFFGKLPARGDFVRRGLPQEFVDVWDAWLAAGIAESRGQLAAEWLPCFIEAPVWRFALAPGIAGGGIAGLFLPSIDRAGRYFPLTLAAPAAQAPFLLAEPDWFAALATAGIAALAEDVAFEAFEAAVAALPPPPPAAMPVPFAGGMAAHNPASLLAASAPPVLLWTEGGTRVAPRLAALPALPAPHHFAELLCDPVARPPVPDPSPPAPRETLFNAALFGDPE